MEISNGNPPLIIDAELYIAIEKFIKNEIINPISKKSNNFLTVDASSFTKRKIKGNNNKERDRCMRFNPSKMLSVYNKLIDIIIKYNGNNRTILLSISNFLPDLIIFIKPRTIETIKNGVGRLIPNGNSRKAI
ncbi:hypothetical protein [Aquimarina rubra]|uniref:Transposase n=1 Tax=Aquimarina rubra TaxID=1920033 RepID=A0ABW5LGU4_9FLAO